MTGKLTGIFFILWCVFLIRFAAGQWSEKDVQETISVFSQMGLEETGVYLEMTGELGTLSTEEKAVDRLEAAAFALGNDSAETVMEQKINGIIRTIKGRCALLPLQNEYHNEIRLFAVKDGFFTRYYLQIRIKGAVDAEDIVLIRRKLEEIRAQEHLDCMISMRLDGTWTRILNAEEKQHFCDYFMEASAAEVIQSGTDGNLWMIYAYGEQFGETITIDQNKINLNLMLRDGGNKTRCFIGFPAVWTDDVSVSGG